MTPSESAKAYARSVVAGKIPAGRYITLACQRFLDDLKRTGPDWPYKYDAAKADRAVKFQELMPHTKGKWAEKEGITLQLLSDYDHKVAEAYGIAYESFLPAKNLIMGGVAKRSAFIIDKAGVVQYAEVKESPGDLPDFNAIQAKLKELA